MFAGGIAPADILYSTNDGNNWIRTNFNKRVNCFADNGSVLYTGCASTDGVWQSTNSGLNWFFSGLSNTSISSLVFSNSVLYASNGSSYSYYYGIYISTDNGLNWNKRFSIPVNILCKTGNYVFAGCPNYKGIYYTTNNGLNWAATSLVNKSITSLYADGSYLYAGTIDSLSNISIYFSANYGQTWSFSYSLPYDAYAQSILKDENYLYAGVTNMGVYYSTNNGVNWTKQLNQNDEVLSFHKNNGNILLGTGQLNGSGGVLFHQIRELILVRLIYITFQFPDLRQWEIQSIQVVKIIALHHMGLF